MPPVIVYLIPESFIGPVYVFFDQKDGVTPFPDPLGQAIHVPENGVVKLSGSVDELIRSAKFGKRPEAMVSVSKTGGRKVMRIFRGTYRNDGGELTEGYIDAQDNLHEFPSNPDAGSGSKNESRNFYYFSPDQLRERMVFSKDGCRHQAFVPQPEKIRSGELDMDAAGVPKCGKFLVASPEEYFGLPDWLWERPWTALYESVEQFVDEANKRAEMKRAAYGTSS